MTGTEKSHAPTRKWWAQQVALVAGWLVSLIQAGWEVTPSIQIAAVGIVAAAIVSYLVPNESTPGGVPRKG